MTDGKMIPYPIENHVYCLDETLQKSFIGDLLEITRSENQKPNNFEEFLIERFGKTLYDLYFNPYNYKVWRRDLTKIPMSWLEGKLPMPTINEMIYNNMNHIEEREFVHSSFYYARKDGSQFLANQLADGLTVMYNTPINKIEQQKDIWTVNGIAFDKIIFCGNVKQLPLLLANCVDITAYEKTIEDLEYHGTTTVFCELDKNPYSWIYMPSREHESHRIICTGNFSPANNADGKMTATVEFTDYITKEDMIDHLSRIPFSPKYVTHNYEKYTYPVQSLETRNAMQSLKKQLETENIYLLGRFAEWEYYNMDVAIGAAIDLNKRIVLT
jgi:protoporphyrinogen oxidase